MRILIFTLALIGYVAAANAQAATDEEANTRAVELLDRAMSGKDGSYEVMRKFAECSGMFDALAKFLGEDLKAQAMATNMRNYGNGAELAATFFWAAYSNKPKIAVLGIIKANEDYYASALSFGGVKNKEITNKIKIF